MYIYIYKYIYVYLTDILKEKTHMKMVHSFDEIVGQPIYLGCHQHPYPSDYLRNEESKLRGQNNQ